MIPKFRAWNNKTQAFIDYGDVVLDLASGKTFAGDVGVMESTIDVTDQIELMQSTGLKDKNGVEIYQDDVVNMCWSDEIGESHWGKITIKNPFDYCIEEARYLIHADELEVIGNVWEDSDLIDG